MALHARYTPDVTYPHLEGLLRQAVVDFHDFWLSQLQNDAQLPQPIKLFRVGDPLRLPQRQV